jgi:hypothetical protein
MTTITDDFRTRVITAIEEIESRVELTINSFIPGRYPYTYAYDFLRAHPADFGVTDQRSLMSRAEAAGWLECQVSSETERIEICLRLADAYIRENNITTIACGWCKEYLVRSSGLIWITRTGEGHCPTPDSPNRAHKPRDVRSH